MSRVTVLLPFVPLIDTIGIVRSTSRIHGGGVVLASPIRCRQRSSERACAAGQLRRPDRRHVALGERDRGVGDRPRALGAGPREGDDPVARVGRAVDRQPAAALAMLGPEPPDPGRDRGRRSSGQSRAGTDRPSWTSGWRPGCRWPYHVRRRPIASSILTTGSSR